MSDAPRTVLFLCTGNSARSILAECDNAAGEACPVWPGRPLAAHWGIEDPAAVEGKRRREAFAHALLYLRNRIDLLLALPGEGIDELALRAIGRSEGASAGG